MTSLADLPDTLRGQFITGRHSLDIAQDWLVLHAPDMIDCLRPPHISAVIGGEEGVSVHLRFATRTQAMHFGHALGHSMDEDNEGSSYFDVQYERFTVHLHYTSSI